MKNHHRIKWLALGTLFVVLLVLVAIWLKTTGKVDRCLDLGGRWDRATESCEGERKSP